VWLQWGVLWLYVWCTKQNKKNEAGWQVGRTEEVLVTSTYTISIWNLELNRLFWRARHTFADIVIELQNCKIVHRVIWVRLAPILGLFEKLQVPQKAENFVTGVANIDFSRKMTNNLRDGNESISDIEWLLCSVGICTESRTPNCYLFEVITDQVHK